MNHMTSNLQTGHELKGGKYRIVKVLGQGGFGITYLATTKTTVQGDLGGMEVEIKVAIKEFFMKEYQVREEDSAHVSTSLASRELSSLYRAKFIKEAQSLSKMKHLRIITVADVFEENNTVYYVMRFLSGGSLQEYVRRSPDGHLGENEALRFAMQIGDGLEYMHTEHQACHYDVKPGNVLLDERGDAVLIDFGLSKNYDATGQQTSSTPVGISQGFAPLEQYNQLLNKFSPQSDIYSLGATLFFMLTGQVPPEASIVNEDGLPEKPAWVTERTWKAVEAAMQPRKKDRPQSIRQWRELLANQSASQNRSVSQQTVVHTPESVETVRVSVNRPTEQTPPNLQSTFNSQETVVNTPKKKSFFARIPAKVVLGLAGLLLVLNAGLFLNACLGYIDPYKNMQEYGSLGFYIAKAPVYPPYLYTNGSDVRHGNGRWHAATILRNHCIVSMLWSAASLLFAAMSFAMVRRPGWRLSFSVVALLLLIVHCVVLMT